MKNKRPVILIITGALLAVFVWYYSAPPFQQTVVYSIQTERMVQSNIVAYSASLRAQAVEVNKGRMPVLTNGFVPMGMPTNGFVGWSQETNEPAAPAPIIDPKYSDPTNWPSDSRPEVQSFYKFAKMTRFYKFDPAVTSDMDAFRFSKEIGTATHSVEIDTRDQRVIHFYSYRERSGSLRDYPGVTDDWAKATGKWHERQMVLETFRILRELGYTETLKAVSQGRHEFIVTPWRVKLPEGGFKIVYPFAKVELYGPNISGDPNEFPRVTAEYRMGPDGPVGLVDWSSLH